MKAKTNQEVEEDKKEPTYDLERARQQRLRDAFDSEAKPIIWKARQFDEIAHWSFVALLGVLSGGCIVSLFGTRHWIVGACAGLAVFVFRVQLGRWLRETAIDLFNTIKRRIAESASHVEETPKMVVATVAPDVPSFEGIPITAIAHDIAFGIKNSGAQEKITREFLNACGITRRRGATDLQDILMKSEFLLYAIASSEKAYPIGAERIAHYGYKSAVTLHSTLMSSPAEDRELVIANAIRRTLGFTVDADPRIQGEASPTCRMVSVREHHEPASRP